MSPIAFVVLKVLRYGALAAACFAMLVIALEIWKHGGDFAALDPAFLAVVAVVMAGALWLARAIGRELASHGS